MKAQHWEQVERTATDLKMTSVEAARMLALKREGKEGIKKTASPYQVVSKQVRNDFSLAMVNYNTKHSQLLPEDNLGKDGKPTPQSKVWDLTVYAVYDHRMFIPLEDVAARLVNTVIDDTVFMTMC